MAGRSAAAKPAKPGPANKRRQQRKPKYESITAVSAKTTEKDVIKLINSLAQRTRDLEAARSVSPSGPPPHRARSRSNARRGVSSASAAPAYPRGNPLTQSMEFTDRDGTAWLAYIESAGPAPGPQTAGVTVLPERHLRFDSATESRFTSLVPAGSPFLAEARLRALLDEARLDLPAPSISGSSTRAVPSPRNRVIEWSAGAAESSQSAIAGWSRGMRRTAGRRGAMRRNVAELLAEAGQSMHGLVEVLLGHRPARL